MPTGSRKICRRPHWSSNSARRFRVSSASSAFGDDWLWNWWILKTLVFAERSHWGPCFIIFTCTWFYHAFNSLHNQRKNVEKLGLSGRFTSPGHPCIKLSDWLNSYRYCFVGWLTSWLRCPTNESHRMLENCAEMSRMGNRIEGPKGLEHIHASTLHLDNSIGQSRTNDNIHNCTWLFLSTKLILSTKGTTYWTINVRTLVHLWYVWSFPQL